jgi:hypothetical protein
MINKWARRLGLAIGFVLFLSQIVQAILSISSSPLRMVWGWIFLAFLAMFLLIALQIFIWKHILNAMGIPLEYLQIARGYSLSLIPRYIPGGVWGYLNRSEWLKEAYQIPASQGNLSSVLEVLQIVLTAFMALFLFAGLFSNPPLPGFLMVVFLTLLLPFLVWKMLSLPVIQQNKWLPFQIHLPDGLLAGYAGVLQWVLLGISTIFLLFGVQSGSVFGLLTLQKSALIAFCYTFSWLAGFFVLFIPGGMGIREVSLSFLLTQLVNVPAGQSAWIAVLSRLLYSLAELLWILIALILGSGARAGEEQTRKG